MGQDETQHHEMLYLQIEPGMQSNHPEPLKTFNFILTPPPDPDVHGHIRMSGKMWCVKNG